MAVVAEGVDYSATANADWNGLAATFAAAGMKFAGRYAVYDKSPGGRGITAPEYRALKAHGVETFLYYEETEAWMLDGWDAGVRAATRAADVIRREGMPEGMPVYYSHDIDPEPQHFAAIDECLKGAASVVGLGRVGFYGGWLGVDHVNAAGTAKWFVQTLAWQYGRGVHPAAHLHQYGFNQYFYGTNCDLVAAMKPHYGQAGDFVPKPVPTTPPPPTYPDKRVPAPENMSHQGVEVIHTKPNRFLCIQGTTFRTAPSLDAPAGVKTPAKAGRKYTFDYQGTVDGEVWLLSKAGSWVMAKNFEVIARKA